MTAISYQQRMEVIEFYLEGRSANEIVAKTGISKGSTVSILKDAREGKFPGLELKDRIDELHSLSVRLRKEALDLTQARLGFTFLKRLLDMAVEPDKLKEWAEFCSEISPTPPEGFIPAAMELLHIQRATGKSYAELASQVKELADKRQKLSDAVGDLAAKERRYGELKAIIAENEKRAIELKAERDKLEAEVSSLNGFIEKRSEALGIPLVQLEAKLRELVNLDGEIAEKRSERNHLQSEIEALNERHQRLSSQMEKASADFERDIKLLKQIRQEVAAIAEMKGKYQTEIENLEWASRVLPFLSDPDKVSDEDFSLILIVVNCVDKWVRRQSQWQLNWFTLKWSDIKKYVEKQRT